MWRIFFQPPLHRAKYDVGIGLVLYGYQLGKPGFRRGFIIIEKRNVFAVGETQGCVAGIGHAGIGFMTIDHWKARARLDQPFDRFTGGSRRVIVKNYHFH